MLPYFHVLCMLEMQFEDALEVRERTLGTDQKLNRLVGVNLSMPSSIGVGGTKHPTLLSNIGPSTMKINEYYSSCCALTRQIKK